MTLCSLFVVLKTHNWKNSSLYILVWDPLSWPVRSWPCNI